jgi:hypothetical protein
MEVQVELQQVAKHVITDGPERSLHAAQHSTA